ncbi:MAG TPA: hypothetical protein PKA64_01900 [Myxococcota bacterium]|nr:hypothetical protein [Myxococcota bacterium]
MEQVDPVPWWFALALGLPVFATLFWFMHRLFAGRWITDPERSPLDEAEERWAALREDPDPASKP